MNEQYCSSSSWSGKFLFWLAGVAAGAACSQFSRVWSMCARDIHYWLKKENTISRGFVLSIDTLPNTISIRKVNPHIHVYRSLIVSDSYNIQQIAQRQSKFPIMTIFGPFSELVKGDKKPDNHETTPGTPPSSPSSKRKADTSIPDGLMAAHGWTHFVVPQIPGHPLHHDPNEIMAAHGWTTLPLPKDDEKDAGIRRHSI